MTQQDVKPYNRMYLRDVFKDYSVLDLEVALWYTALWKHSVSKIDVTIFFQNFE